MITTWKEKKKLAEAMASKWDQDMLKDAIPQETRQSLIQASIKQFTTTPILLVACITMKDMNTYQDPHRQACEHTMATQSLAAAIQNMLLIASSKGLGACWYCAPLFCQSVVRSVLKLPQDVEPQALITIGYPSATPPPPPRKRVKDIVHENRWRGETY